MGWIADCRELVRAEGLSPRWLDELRAVAAGSAIVVVAEAEERVRPVHPAVLVLPR